MTMAQGGGRVHTVLPGGVQQQGVRLLGARAAAGQVDRLRAPVTTGTRRTLRLHRTDAGTARVPGPQLPDPAQHVAQLQAVPLRLNPVGAAALPV